MIYSNRDSATKSTDPSRRARGIFDESLHDSNSLRTGKISQWFHWQTHARRDVSKGEKNNSILKLPITIANFQLLFLLIIETGVCWHSSIIAVNQILLSLFNYYLHTPHGTFLHLYDSSITLPVLPRTDTEGNWTPPDKGANTKTRLQMPRTRRGGREEDPGSCPCQQRSLQNGSVNTHPGTISGQIPKKVSLFPGRTHTH